MPSGDGRFFCGTLAHNLMLVLLLSLTLLFQDIPAKPAESGTIIGTLKTELGTPAVGVRVAAMAVPESAAVISSLSALASIGETDAQGHFHLENIPQGRYYVTAGRVDYPTYFPGTQDITAGRIVAVKPGDSIPGIDFVMSSIAVRPLGNSFGSTSIPLIAIGINVSVEDGGLVPVFSTAGFTTLRFIRTLDGQTTSMPINSSSVSVAVATGPAPEFRVSVENLPNGYALKSILYKATDITNGTLRLSPVATPPTGTNGSTTFSTIVSMINSTVPGAVFVNMAAPLPTETVSITLTASPSTRNGVGVRVTGKAKNSEIRSVYISGTPGIFYSDGSFEFRGVLPGRHTISTPDNPSSSQPLATTIIIGNQDLAGIELHDTPVLPLNVVTPKPPEPSGSRAPGFVVLPAAIQGRVVDEMTREPIVAGMVFLTGHYGSSIQLDKDGRFEFPKLSPGSYQMEIHPFGHLDIRKTIVVGEEDLHLNLATPMGEGLIQ